jgi:diguanylate cyclase (GGDEF)-like protein
MDDDDENRAMNLAARYGGDEFIALLADTSADGARTFIQRVNTRFQEEMGRFGHPPLTISAGFAECDHSMKTAEALIEAADQALYRVKPSRSAR